METKSNYAFVTLFDPLPFLVWAVCLQLITWSRQSSFPWSPFFVSFPSSLSFATNTGRVSNRRSILQSQSQCWRTSGWHHRVNTVVVLLAWITVTTVKWISWMFQSCSVTQEYKWMIMSARSLCLLFLHKLKRVTTTNLWKSTSHHPSLYPLLLSHQGYQLLQSDVYFLTPHMTW